MIPEKDSPVIEIPLTFDGTSKPQGLDNSKFYLSLLVFGVWVFISIVSLFTDLEVIQKVLFILGSFLVGMFIVRILLMREPYFKKKREELVEKDYQYPYSMFWNIYEVTDSFPYICRYANGLKSVFVAFDKDVIVGKERDNEYLHYEAISEAYLQMAKRGIDCMHIDYMDTVGKDDRVKSLFNMANDTENEDLKEILTRIFDNVEDIMQHSYASYDVYCFFYNGKDDLFMDELDVVINSFLDANYIRCRVLNKEEIGQLVKSVMNIEKFSVNESCEKLFTDLGGTHYLTPIWIERGEERKILHKTREEIEAERNVKEAEKGLRNSKVKRRGISGKMRKIKDEQEIDLFDNGEQNIQNNQGYNQQQMYNLQQQNYQQGYQQQMYPNNYPQENYQQNQVPFVESQEKEPENTMFDNDYFNGNTTNNNNTNVGKKNKNIIDDNEDIDLF